MQQINCYSQKTEQEAIEIIKDRLFWVCSDRELKKNRNTFIFSVDEQYEYQGFNFDFGPIDISQVTNFCQELYYILKNPTLSQTVIILQCSQYFDKKANSALLICSYMILYLNYSPEQAWNLFSSQLIQPIVPFRDCLNIVYSTYDCIVLDCLKGLKEAVKLNWLNISNFNHIKYDHLANLTNGNISEIVPNKIYAFRGPRNIRENGVNIAKPEDFIETFKQLNITKVIQLNEQGYDENKFIQAGIKHIKIIFPDGGLPTNSQIEQFIEEVENSDGNIGVHCQAGLGRTGTMIALYCMKTYYFPAKPLIAYIKLLRPGSIHGPQHQFIIQKEKEFLPKETKKLSVKYNPCHSMEELDKKISEIDIFDFIDKI